MHRGSSYAKYTIPKDRFVLFLLEYKHERSDHLVRSPRVSPSLSPLQVVVAVDALGLCGAEQAKAVELVRSALTSISAGPSKGDLQTLEVQLSTFLLDSCPSLKAFVPENTDSPCAGLAALSQAMRVMQVCCRVGGGQWRSASRPFCTPNPLLPPPYAWLPQPKDWKPPRVRCFIKAVH